ncbi:unnamed protein product, partial [Rotaria socialis]
MVHTKEQTVKENKLRNVNQSNAIIDTFEEIYNTKIAIEIKDIFKECKDKTKKVLVLGRAGVGKTTFCRYVAHEWATCKIWSQYKLVVLIPLRRVTESRYPEGTQYSLIDLVKKEYFPCDELSTEGTRLFEELHKDGKVLWLLDGYDEFVQNMPAHLQDLFNQVRTQDHILTSSPYFVTLPYTAQIEIIGFTNDNISKYVKQFLNQIGSEAHNSSYEVENILSFLKQNPMISGIAHIPINLELICNVWDDTARLETKSLTITKLYDKLTEWLCRQYMARQKKNIQMTKDEDIFKDCHKPLAFLETLAFKGMENNSIILRSTLLKEVFMETRYSSEVFVDALNIGFLKPLNDNNLTDGSQNEVDKDHYFEHLSVQEFFAARYLVTVLNGSEPHKMIQFINHHKYNRRFASMLSFASGLLANSCNKKYIETFWDIILGEPLDMVGIRHIEIVLSCMEQAHHNTNFKQWKELINYIINSIKCAVHSEHTEIRTYLNDALLRSPSIANEREIITTFTNLLEANNTTRNERVLSLIIGLPIFYHQPQFIQFLVTALTGESSSSRCDACETLGCIGEKAPTKYVIAALVATLRNADDAVRRAAVGALGRIGETGATNDVIAALLIALRDPRDAVRAKACEALGQLGEKAARNDVIAALVTTLENADDNVRRTAVEALGRIGETGATDDVIAPLIA